MTRRITVDLPDEIVERLNLEADISAYVAAAIRDQMDREENIAALAAPGMNVTVEGLARARARIESARARTTPERYAELRKIGRSAA